MFTLPNLTSECTGTVWQLGSAGVAEGAQSVSQTAQLALRGKAPRKGKKGRREE